MTVGEAMALITSKRRLRFHVSVQYSFAREFNTRLVQVPRQSAFGLLFDLPLKLQIKAYLDGKDLVIG